MWSSKIDARVLNESYLNLWNQIAKVDLKTMKGSRISRLRNVILGNDSYDPKRPLHARILNDLNHPITQHLIKIYTKECFVYKELNLTTRLKIEDGIEYFGPYAAAFG